MSNHKKVALFLICLLLTNTACVQNSFDSKVGETPGSKEPSSASLGRSASVHCSQDNDCLAGEVCSDTLCQVSRCDDVQPTASHSPLGRLGYLAKYRQIVIAHSDGGDHQHRMQGFERDGRDLHPMAPMSSATELGNAPLIKAIAGGHLLGTEREQVAVLLQGAKEIHLLGADHPGVSIHLDFLPEAIAVGEVDDTGLESLVAISKDGDIALCNAQIDKCAHSHLEGHVQALNVAVADTDGDGLSEIVLLVSDHGHQQIRVWKANQEQAISGNLQRTFADLQEHLSDWWGALGTWANLGFSHGGELNLVALAAGDLDGDGKAEIIGLHEELVNVSVGQPLVQYVADFAEKNLGLHPRKTLYTFQIANNQLTEMNHASVHENSKSLLVDNTEGDNHATVMLLRDTGDLEMLGADESLTKPLKQVLISKVSSDAVSSSLLLATVDWNGDSVRGTLAGAPQVKAGNVIPVAVLNFPPFSAQDSKEPSMVSMGNSETTKEEDRNIIQVFFSAGATLSGVPLGPGGRALLTSGKFTTIKQITSKAKLVGHSYHDQADLSEHNPNYAAVVLSSACFHVYKYTVRDPRNKTGQQGAQVHVYLPVKSHQMLWSTERYNALAAAVGKGMPLIPVNVHVGELESYPTEPKYLSGKPIENQDVVFQGDPVEVGSEGDTNWSFSMSQGDEKRIEKDNRILVQAAATLGFGVGAFTEDTLTQGHEATLQLLQTTSFSGSVAPIRNSKQSPEDKWSLRKYSFTPYLIKEPYKDASGRDAAYYAVTYTVAKH